MSFTHTKPNQTPHARATRQKKAAFPSGEALRVQFRFLVITHVRSSVLFVSYLVVVRIRFVRRFVH